MKLAFYQGNISEKMRDKPSILRGDSDVRVDTIYLLDRISNGSTDTVQINPGSFVQALAVKRNRAVTVVLQQKHFNEFHKQRSDS